MTNRIPYERPPGERLAVLETQMAGMKITVDEIAGMVRDIHDRQMRGAGATYFIGKGLHLLALGVAGLGGSLVQRVWG